MAGPGLHLPEKVITNFDLEKMVDTTDEWIRSRTGIERRHVAADGETTVDLAEKAARRALDAAGVAPAEVDFIAFGPTTPDLVFPNCCTLLPQREGCRAGSPSGSRSSWRGTKCSRSPSPSSAAGLTRHWRPTGWSAARSTGWYPTRPTSGSSRRRRAGSTYPWNG